MAEMVLQRLDKWVVLNGLKLNIKKTKYMVFSNSRSDSDDLRITLNGVQIERTDSERFLGVIVESNLNWKIHISNLAAKISRNAGILYKLKGLVPNKVLRLVYNSLIQSHINYCSNVWGLGAKSTLNSIFVSQKKAIRAVENRFNNCFYNKDTGELPCHTKHIFARNKLLTIYNIVAKNCLAAMHKVYLDKSPVNVQRLFDVNREPKQNSRRDPEFFKIPRTRIKVLDKTLPYAGSKLYNYTCNKLNKLNKEQSDLKNRNLTLETTFLNTFKNLINRYLLDAQGVGTEEWSTENFVLYL